MCYAAHVTRAPVRRPNPRQVISARRDCELCRTHALSVPMSGRSSKNRPRERSALDSDSTRKQVTELLEYSAGVNACRGSA